MSPYMGEEGIPSDWGGKYIERWTHTIVSNMCTRYEYINLCVWTTEENVKGGCPLWFTSLTTICAYRTVTQVCSGLLLGLSVTD